MKYKTSKKLSQEFPDQSYFKLKIGYDFEQLEAFYNSVVTLKKFYSKHSKLIETLFKNGWFYHQSLYGEKPELKLYNKGFSCDDFQTKPIVISVKEVAKLFGQNGWERSANSSLCGSINWSKELDGVRLTIDSAELIKPSLIKVVKIN